MRIMYVVNSLSKSGPSNQLKYIIENLEEDTNSHLVILTHGDEDNIDEILNLGIEVINLGLSFRDYLIKGKKALSNIIQKINPDIIHSHGLRPDYLISRLKNKNSNWFITSRNYPYEDYPMKFGSVTGKVMGWMHLKAMKKCSNVVSCSETIQSKLAGHKIKSEVVYNGTLVPDFKPGTKLLSDYEKPIFLVVGSLIKRKNNEFIINAFNQYNKTKPGTLIFLGDGKQFEVLNSISNDNTVFKGQVDNVHEYMQQADYLISASLSEGLPNTVLEALANRLPVIISSISPHKELESKFNEQCKIFHLENSYEELSEILKKPEINRDSFRTSKFKNTFSKYFTAQSMSRNYQELYLSVVSNKKI